MLDFLIIGAQKAGTTSLHKYLCDNPAIALPPTKEAPFFNVEERFRKGADWFFSEFYEQKPNTLATGKASPTYMLNPDLVASRAFEHNPDMKIIMLLRDPIDRAVSQYRMNVKRNSEQRPINEVFSELQSTTALEESRGTPTEINSYLIAGEYSRIRDTFAKYFDDNQILLLPSQLLDIDTPKAMKVIYDFLEIDYYESDTYRKKYHEGGVVRYKFINRLQSLSIIRLPLKMILSPRFRRRLKFWIDQWNTKKTSNSNQIVNKIDRDLRKHFKLEYTIIDELSKKYDIRF